MYIAVFRKLVCGYVYSGIQYVGLWLQKNVNITALLLLACLQHNSDTTTLLVHQYPIPSPKYYLHLLSYCHFTLFVHFATFCSAALSIYS